MTLTSRDRDSRGFYGFSTGGNSHDHRPQEQDGAELSIWAMEWGSYAAAFDELARRLEEAQQKIVAQQESLAKFREEIVDNIAVEGPLSSVIEILKENDDVPALDALKAKVAAEAKAEALEEAIERLWERVGREEWSMPLGPHTPKGESDTVL